MMHCVAKLKIPPAHVFGHLLLTYLLFAQNIYARKRKNETTNDRTGLIGAVPEQDLKYTDAIACQGAKLFIACPNAYDKIQIRTSFYGREDTVTCKHPELPSDKTCTEQNTTVNNMVKDLCQGESQCEVAVTNDFLAKVGTIICPNVYKYLYVKYRCVPKSALPDVPKVPQLPEDTPTSLTITSTSTTPVQCCYVVPMAGGSQTTTADTLGGTIVRHENGTQSVEERITSQRPRIVQAQQVPKITEIIQGHTASSVKSDALPARRTQLETPNVSQIKLNTQLEFLEAQAKRLGISNLLSVDSSHPGDTSLRKREFIPKAQQNKNRHWMQERRKRMKHFLKGTSKHQRT